MLVTIIIFIAILAVLVLVHEWGHFITARRAGIKVEEFGFGFPPRAIGIYKAKDGRWKAVGRKVAQADSTIYSFNWLPLGGFVRIKGEQGESESDPDSFASRSVGRRIWIISAGVLMNLVLTVFLISLGFLIGLPQVIDKSIPPSANIKDERIQIIEVVEGLPASRQGIVLGDTIASVDGLTISTLDEIQDYLDSKIGQEVVVTIRRGDETITQSITPEILEETGRGGIGVGLVNVALVSYPVHLALWNGIVTTINLFWLIIVAFYELFVSLVSGHGVTVDISGPVGIAVITGQVARLGFLYVLQFAALLSLNLAIINFLPFPALDGGRVFFLILGKLKGKPIDIKTETIAHNIGFFILMLLVLLVTVRDISKFGDKFSSWWQSFAGLL
ncbi:MAG: RIP metalloprotease RseP [Candidatus Buchananbacteria bacterium CG10_big_fil_rev_8_21_14_0_10_42_9]|uniref:Zinc metalloprotease n=1 Tax=Candidatus Buchananbacteria bacterium CG10_big_fil_rev_8_21_14_0_10_42_9 TaxID=1974526 RepID=A0A2H0W2H9_9BACT|nr:MAG: RIP metalloprotease RseP [Candidatus Buchananbacteria bacterium CG10_big_fil_rev_8_21_14_0_10_42_9]